MLTPTTDIAGDCDDDTRRLREMAVKARDFITSFKWSLPITSEYFVDGVGGVVAIFLFEFDGKIGGTDDRLWVFVGDLPSVYVIVELPTNARELLEGYCELMDDWVHAVLVTRDFNGVYPVDAAETPGNGEDLRSRLDFLRRELIPHFSDEPIELS